MLKSPHVADLKPMVENWIANLQEVDSITDVWTDCQKKVPDGWSSCCYSSQSYWCLHCFVY